MGLSPWYLERRENHDFFQLEFGNTLIGRVENSTIIVKSVFSSRQQCCITVTSDNLDDIFLEDLGSCNGTYVNTKVHKRNKIRLKEGDTIGIGCAIVDRDENAHEDYYTFTLKRDKVDKIVVNIEDEDDEHGNDDGVIDLVGDDDDDDDETDSEIVIIKDDDEEEVPIVKVEKKNGEVKVVKEPPTIEKSMCVVKMEEQVEDVIVVEEPNTIEKAMGAVKIKEQVDEVMMVEEPQSIEKEMCVVKMEEQAEDVIVVEEPIPIENEKSMCAVKMEEQVEDVIVVEEPNPIENEKSMYVVKMEEQVDDVIVVEEPYTVEKAMDAVKMKEKVDEVMVVEEPQSIDKNDNVDVNVKVEKNNDEGMVAEEQYNVCVIKVEKAETVNEKVDEVQNVSAIKVERGDEIYNVDDEQHAIKELSFSMKQNIVSEIIEIDDMFSEDEIEEEADLFHRYEIKQELSMRHDNSVDCVSITDSDSEENKDLDGKEGDNVEEKMGDDDEEEEDIKVNKWVLKLSQNVGDKVDFAVNERHQDNSEDREDDILRELRSVFEDMPCVPTDNDYLIKELIDPGIIKIEDDDDDFLQITKLPPQEKVSPIEIVPKLPSPEKFLSVPKITSPEIEIKLKKCSVLVKKIPVPQVQPAQREVVHNANVERPPLPKDSIKRKLSVSSKLSHVERDNDSDVRQSDENDVKRRKKHREDSEKTRNVESSRRKSADHKERSKKHGSSKEEKTERWMVSIPSKSSSSENDRHESHSKRRHSSHRSEHNSTPKYSNSDEKTSDHKIKFTRILDSEIRQNSSTKRPLEVIETIDTPIREHQIKDNRDVNLSEKSKTKWLEQKSQPATKQLQVKLTKIVDSKIGHTSSTKRPLENIETLDTSFREQEIKGNRDVDLDEKLEAKGLEAKLKPTTKVARTIEVIDPFDMPHRKGHLRGISKETSEKIRQPKTTDDIRRKQCRAVMATKNENNVQNLKRKYKQSYSADRRRQSRSEAEKVREERKNRLHQIALSNKVERPDDGEPKVLNVPKVKLTESNRGLFLTEDLPCKIPGRRKSICAVDTKTDKPSEDKNRCTKPTSINDFGTIGKSISTFPKIPKVTLKLPARRSPPPPVVPKKHRVAWSTSSENSKSTLGQSTSFQSAIQAQPSMGPKVQSVARQIPLECTSKSLHLPQAELSPALAKILREARSTSVETNKSPPKQLPLPSPPILLKISRLAGSINSGHLKSPPLQSPPLLPSPMVNSVPQAFIPEPAPIKILAPKKSILVTRTSPSDGIKSVKKVKFCDDVRIEYFEITTTRPLLKVSQARINENQIAKSKQLISAQPVKKAAVSLNFHPGENIINDITLWKPDWLKMNGDTLPPINGTNFLLPIVHIYQNCNEYESIMIPLLKVELWHQIRNDYEMRRNCKFRATVQSLKLVPKGNALRYQFICELQDSMDNNMRDQVKEGMLVIMNAAGKKCFAYLIFKDCMRSKDRQVTYISLEVAESSITEMIKYEMHVEITCVAYIRVEVVNMGFIYDLKESPLCDMILNPPENIDMPKVLDDYNPILDVTLNHEQYKIVNYASRQCLDQTKSNVILIDGPPGTGKSYLIANLVSTLLYLPEPVKLKILICSASNNAIDIIMEKLIGIRMENKKNKSPRDIRLLRFGVLDKMSLPVQPYSLQNFVKKNFDTWKREFEASMVVSGASITTLLNEKKALETRLANLTHNPGRSDDKIKLEHDLMRIKNIMKGNNMAYSKLRNKERQLMSDLICKADVICTTLTSCVQLMKNLRTMDICIIDEATQCTEPWSIIPLKFKIKKLILVGDTKQLPAVVVSSEAKENGLGDSLFTRIQHSFDVKNQSPVLPMTTQYRMHPEICAFPNKYFYEGKLKSCYTAKQGTSMPLKPYGLVSLDCLQNGTDSNLSVYNVEEAKFVGHLVHELSKWVDIQKCSIGIITPYQQQKQEIISTLSIYKLNDNVYVNTIDGFQGKECDIIILATTRTTGTGFLGNPQRLNVALTRARHSLLICGNFIKLKNVPMWSRLIEDAIGRQVFYKFNNSFTDLFAKLI